jgi:hypothetical protein
LSWVIPASSDKLYLPLARSSCRVALSFQGDKIIAVEPGPAFDLAKWHQVAEEIENSILAGPRKIGREFSFSTFRVSGSWRGNRSGVQILPPPSDAPRAPSEMADHPFILEFPIQGTDFWPVANHRRMREHRNLTLLLNLLLKGRTSLLHPRSTIEHFWARVDDKGGKDRIAWVQHYFIANLGRAVIDELSAPIGEELEMVAPEEYYAQLGHDAKGLRVPTDLDESICL